MSGTALVTGAAVRVGRAIALALADRGYRIALHYRSSGDAARETAGAIAARGGEATLFQADLADVEEVRRLVPQVREACPDFSVLVNNASIFERAGLAETDADLYARTFDVNLRAPLLLCRDFAANVETGVIVNLLDQRITGSDPRHFAYGLTKKALAALTEMAAVELGPRIRVCGVCPGPVLPPPGKDRAYLAQLAAEVPLRQAGTPEDVAAAVVALVEQPYVTGELLFVDGGQHLL